MPSVGIPINNPFPGMNPYLEGRWGDVHTGLCAAIRAALQPQLPSGLRARAEERILLSDEGETERIRRGDVVMIEASGASVLALGEGGIAVATPVVVQVPQDVRVHRWIQIVDTAGGKVVTVLEILSPWNKAAGRANKAYRRKVAEYLSSDVNFVEVDLLRSTRRHLLVSHDALPPKRRAPYLVCVSRPKSRTTWEIYPMPLRDPLPAIPIPCRPSDADVPLALQPLIDRIYVEGGHDDIDYAEPPPDPDLPKEDREWVAATVATSIRSR